LASLEIIENIIVQNSPNTVSLKNKDSNNNKLITEKAGGIIEFSVEIGSSAKSFCFSLPDKKAPLKSEA